MNYQIDCDVVVIGAGISGLTAASKIIEKEPTLNVTVLEASDRIGGRILSVPLLSKNGKYCYYDIGGSWFNPNQKQIIGLIEKFNIPLQKNKNNVGKTTVVNRDNCKSKREDILDIYHKTDKIQITKFITKIEEYCKKIDFKNFDYVKWGHLARMTVARFIVDNVKTLEAQTFLLNIISLNLSSDVQNISVLCYIFYCTCTRGIHKQLYLGNDFHQYYLQNGALEICNKMAEIIEEEYITKNEKVTQISHHSHYVKITTNNKIYYSYYVIVAIPPQAVLNIEFIPQPKKLNIMKSVTDGKICKFVATYERQFWRDKNLNGDIFIMNNSPFICCINISSTAKGPALTGYLKQTLNKTQILNILKNCLGDEALNPLDFYQKTWEKCECPFNSFTSTEFNELKSPDGRIFWAGTETASEWFGCIAGAVQAGHRAAFEILYDLRPSLLTIQDILVIYPFTVQTEEIRTPDNFFHKNILRWYFLTPFGLVLIFSLYKLIVKGYFFKFKLFVNSLLRKKIKV